MKGLNTVDQFVLLLARAGHDSPIPGRLFLQKEVYALSKRVPSLSSELGFDAHLLGPHSDLLETESEQLELSGLIDSSGGGIRLTESGHEAAAEIARGFSGPVLGAVEDTKELLNDLHPDELLALIYLGETLPVFEAESTEFERIKRNRVALALRLLKKVKVSTSKAAEIAGLSVDELIERFDKIPA